MDINGDTVVWASAGVVAVGIVAGAAVRYAKREVNADVSADKVRLLEGRADAQAVTLASLDKRLSLLEQSHDAHDANDERLFGEFRGAMESVRVSLDEMRQYLMDVLVALKVKDRPRDPRDT